MLSIYGYSMLAVAGIILFYHLARMVVDTAHQGVVFGRSTNQVWAPIRLMVAILLLVPVGQGLSSGQYLVVKIAKEGSALADRAWEGFRTAIGTNSFTPLYPRQPDMTGRASLAVEMELCRLAYNQTILNTKDETLSKLAGTITGIRKDVPTVTRPEQWIYTNNLHRDQALCGSYNYDGLHQRSLLVKNETTPLTPLVTSLASSGKADTDALIAQAQSVAQHAISIFNTTTPNSSINLQGDIAGIVQTLTGKYQNSIHNGVLGNTMTAVNGRVNELLAIGWVGAGAAFFQAASAQILIEDLVNIATPSITPPILAYPHLTRQALHILSTDNSFSSDSMAILKSLYTNSSHMSQQVHDWIMSDAEAGAISIAPSSFDAEAQSHQLLPIDRQLDLALRATDAAATSLHLWGRGTDSLIPQLSPYDLPAITDIFSRLISFASQQMKLAQWMISYAAAGAQDTPKALGNLPLFILALLMLIGASSMMYIVPLIPLLRYVGSVIGWILLCLEAIIAMPIVAIAHLTPSGEGLSGGMAKQAYLLWLSLFIRPITTLLAFIGSLLVFLTATYIFVLSLDAIMTMGLRDYSAAAVGYHCFIILTLNIGVLILANLCFRAPQDFPNFVLRWINSPAQNDNGNGGISTAANSPSPVQSGGGNGVIGSMSLSSNPLIVGSSYSPNGGEQRSQHSLQTTSAHFATSQHDVTTSAETFPVKNETVTGQMATAGATEHQSSTMITSPQSPLQKGTSQKSTDYVNKGFFPDKK